VEERKKKSYTLKRVYALVTRSMTLTRKLPSTKEENSICFFFWETKHTTTQHTSTGSCNIDHQVIHMLRLRTEGTCSLFSLQIMLTLLVVNHANNRFVSRPFKLHNQTNIPKGSYLMTIMEREKEKEAKH
jgi:hypothetical protein